MTTPADNDHNNPRVQRRTPRLIALAMLGALLFNYPLLSLFEQGELFGLPLPVIYLFGAWALLIALAALTLQRRARKPPADNSAPTDEAGN